MPLGKLYNGVNSDLIVGVDYRLFDDAYDNWWGS